MVHVDASGCVSGNLGPLPPPRNRGLPWFRTEVRKSGKPEVRWGRVGEGGNRKC